jgi:TIR domain
MADIFLSYTEKDRVAVRRLADSLLSVGWTVWWDRRIPAGLTWRSVLERELQNMRCMVVLWSSNSVASEWVCEEAAEGRRLGRLVPVLIEPVRPPAGFREIQAADLVDWDGSSDSPGLRQLVEDIERLIGKPANPVGSAPAPDADHERPGPVPPPRPPTRQPFPWVMSGLIGVIAVAAGTYFGTVARRPVEARNEWPARPAAAPPLPAPSSAAGPTVMAAASSAAGNVASASTAAAHRAAALPPPSRCVALRERLALGETLSSQSQLFYNQECRK